MVKIWNTGCSVVILQYFNTVFYQPFKGDFIFNFEIWVLSVEMFKSRVTRDENCIKNSEEIILYLSC